MNFNDFDLPSNKRFGFFFASVFFLTSCYLYLERVITASYLCATLSFLFLIVTLWKPDLLRPLNKLWMLFGLFLGMIISPIVLGAIFFGLFTPVGLLMRLFGRDELRLHFIKKKTFWIARGFKHRQTSTFKNQF